MLAILDCLLGDKDFYNSLAMADDAYNKKAMSQIPQCPDCGGVLPFTAGEDIAMYHEWKAANYLHGFPPESRRKAE